MVIQSLGSRALIDGSHDVEERLLMADLPPEYPMDPTRRIEELLSTASNEMTVFLEDDSTGVQKSHDVYLITDLSEESIRSGIEAARQAGHRLVFILTNSRALSSRRAEALNRRIARILVKFADEVGLDFRIGSRSDSTLRGHFPLEPLALAEVLRSYVGKIDGIIVCHVFLTEMSRITVNRIHMLRVMKDDGSFWYRPVHRTGFAKDKRFGYPTSDIAKYVEYKFAVSGLGSVRAEDVLHIGIDEIRIGGPEDVRSKLLEAEDGRIITFDVVTRRDLQVFVLGLLMAEREGKRYIYRSAASLPPVRVNMKDIPILNRKEILGDELPTRNILCLWGSIVELSNIQLETTLNGIPDLMPIPLDVRRVLKSDKEMEDVIDQVSTGIEEVFRRGQHAMVYTMPRTEFPPEMLPDEARAASQQRIAFALQEVYNRLKAHPRVVIFKGGVTSSTGLFNSGARRVFVLGQIAPGIPIVKVLPQDNERFPGEELFMILGPGNVGLPGTYVDIIKKLSCK